MLRPPPTAARDGTPILRDARPLARLFPFRPDPPGRSLPSRGSPTPMPNGPDQRANRNRRPRRRSQSTNRLPVTEQDEVAELEAARERNDLDISDLREMSVKELAAGRRQARHRGRRPPRGAGRPDPPGPDRARRARVRLRHPGRGRRRLRLHAPPRPPAERGRRLRLELSQVRRFGLRIGDRVTGAVRAPREGEKYCGLIRVDSVNGVDPETARRRPYFNDLTPIHPIELINLESDPKNLSQRLVNLVNPLGKGQRALIVSPPKAGKTMLLKNIANGITRQLPGHPAHGRPHRRAAGGGHGHAPLGARRGHQLDLRRADREPHPRRRDGARDRQAPGRDRPGRRDPARLDHPPRARLQPRAAAVAAGRCRVVSTRSRSTRPSASSAPRARSRRAAR